MPTNKELIQEGIFDWIKRNREAYQKQVSGESDGSKDGWGVRAAGAVGTGLGEAYKFTRDKVKPTLGKRLQSIGKRIEGNKEKSDSGTSSPSTPNYSIKGLVKSKPKPAASDWGTKLGNLSNLGSINPKVAPAITAGITKASKSTSTPYSIKNISKSNVIPYKPKGTK